MVQGYSLSPDVLLGPGRGSLSTEARDTATRRQLPGRTPRSLRSDCGLQCAPLPDRDQHSSTPGAQQPAKRRSNPATLPNTGGSPAKRVRPPSGSGNKEKCNKKLTDSKQPWRPALACPPSPHLGSRSDSSGWCVEEAATQRRTTLPQHSSPRPRLRELQNSSHTELFEWDIATAGK